MNTATPIVIGGIDSNGLTVLALIIGATIVIYTIYSIRKILERSARERTKREIAAYVSEGTLTAADGAKLLSADTDDAERMIADGVAWGMVKPEKAERLIRAIRNQPPSDAVPSPTRAQTS